MSRALHKLSETKIRTYKTDKQTRLSDGGGLYLVVHVSGKKVWRFMHYDSAGAQKTRNIGEYPACSLAEARTRAAGLRDSIQSGTDPMSIRDKLEPLDKWAKIYLDGKADGSLDGKARAAKTIIRDRKALDLVLAVIGEEDVRALTTSKLDDALRSLASAETRYRAKYLLDQVFAWCVFKEVIKYNPASALSVVHSQPKAKGYAAFFEPERIGKLLRDVQAYKGLAGVDVALEILLRTALRPGELRLAEWSWLDLDKAVLSLPASITKTRTGREVFLSRQTVELFRRLESLRRQASPLILPGLGSSKERGAVVQPLSDMAFTAALRRMGYPATVLHVHGVRKIFSTVANSSGEFRPDVIEAALGHVQPGVRAVYNKATYEKELRALAVWWSDALDRFAAEKGQVLK